jgi:hypothetical protein
MPTTPLQDAYAPGIRRREEIVARDYCGGTPVVEECADKQFEVLWSFGRLVVTVGITGAVGYFAATATNTIMADVTINGQQGATIDPLAFAAVVATVGLAIAAIPYLPGRAGQ